MIAAPMSRVIATTPADRTASSIVSARIGATITAGIVATTMSQARTRLWSPPNERSRIVARPAGMSTSQSCRK